MGTFRDWLHVATLGAFWGGFMLYWSTRIQKQRTRKWPPSFADIISLSLLSLWFGIMVTFDWGRAFRSPLVFITVASFIGGVIFGRLARNETRQALTEGK